MALERLDGVTGRAEVLDAAVEAESEEQARSLAPAFALLTVEHARNPLRAIVDGRPAAMTKAGEALVALPVDYVSWTERTSAFAHRPDLLPHRPEVFTTGRFSALARAELEKLGWRLRENVPLPDAL